MKLADIIVALSSLARTGWMLRGVHASAAESVSEHLFASALVAYELAHRARKRGIRVSPERSMAIALVHDLAEALIGDISRRAELGEAKEVAERRAFESLPVSAEIRELYDEYRSGKSTEALLAKLGDELATHIVARSYMRLGHATGDIAESSLRNARELARRIGIEEELGDLLPDLEKI